MRLILARHGYAGQPDPEEWPNDDERPLTPRGSRKLIKAAEGIRKLGKPNRVLASPSVRTMQTAGILQSHGGWPKPRKATFLNDGTDPKMIVKAIQAQHAAGVKTLGLVGHEPNLGSLIGYLLTDTEDAGKEVRLKKGGAAVVDYRPGKSRLLDVFSRKELSKLRSHGYELPA